MASLTLPVEPLVDFLPNSILEGFCFLLRCKVQSDQTVLQRRNEQRHTQTKKNGLDDVSSRREGVSLRLQGRCESRPWARSRRAGRRAPAPTPASLPAESPGYTRSIAGVNAGRV